MNIQLLKGKFAQLLSYIFILTFYHKLSIGQERPRYKL